MTTALATHHPGAVVDTVRVAFRDDGTNKRARLELTYSAGSGPATVFAKAVDPAHADLVALTSGLYHEPRLFSSGVPLPLDHPTVYVALIDEEHSDFLMIMEDVVARGADPRDSTRPMTVNQVAAGVRGLARLHSAYWGNRLTGNQALGWVEPFVAFEGMQYAPLHIARERLGDTVAAEIVALNGEQLFIDIWARYIGTLTTSPQTLLHGDPHIGNTYVLPDDDVGFLDWQMARRGNWSLDLGYFLQGALTIEDRRRSERDLLEEYRGRADAARPRDAEHRGHAASLPPLGRTRAGDLDGHAVGRRRLAEPGDLPRACAAVCRGIHRSRHPARRLTQSSETPIVFAPWRHSRDAGRSSPAAPAGSASPPPPSSVGGRQGGAGRIEKAALDGAVDQLRDDGVEAHGVVCDVRSLDAVTTMADQAFDLLGKVHVVFNNAGIAYGGPDRRRHPRRLALGDRRRPVGAIHGVEAFLPRIIEQGGDRHIMFTSSFAGMVANAGLGPYCVAKFGVVALAESLSRELKGQDIGVSVLCPMIVDTPIMATPNAPAAPTTVPHQPGRRSRAGWRARQPTDDNVRPDDVARLTADAVLANRLYILPHRASRESIPRRFERIDRTYDEQTAEGWRH